MMIKFGAHRFKKGRLFDGMKNDDEGYHMNEGMDPSIPRAEFESDYMNKL
jgi:hypothetical protein